MKQCFTGRTSCFTEKDLFEKPNASNLKRNTLFSGLMERMSQEHEGQTFTQESVALLRQLDRAACEICGTVRSRRGNRCNHCRTDTATRDIVV